MYFVLCHTYELEALVVIFRDLDLGEPPTVSYTMRYRCRQYVVEIDADRSRGANHTLISVAPTKVDGTVGDPVQLSFRQLVKAEGRPYLPRYVFGYYSGPSNRFETHFRRHQEKFYRALISPMAERGSLPLRPLFYARLVHSQFVLLGFFLDPDPTVQDFLRTYLHVEALESVLFVMQRPDWANTRRGDPRFWGAVGVVRDFLDRLYGRALAPLSLKAGRAEELLYLFVKDIRVLEELFADYGTLSDFFKTLESTYLSDLIREVRIRVRIHGVKEPLTFRELSEGEQQLLTVLGLLRFTREEESLFLLDEPDTHLNPAWSLEYLELLSQVVGDRETSHAIIATHDPVMIAGLCKEQVQILYRDEETGDIRAKQADEDPRGMGVAALLTSELFGLRSSVDLDTLRKLDRKRELVATDELSSDEREELARLSEELGNLDFTRSVRDPLYGPFVEAMTRLGEYQALKKPTLSPIEQDKQRRLARLIVQDLLQRRSR